jgi:hypothetical protein
MNEVLVLGAEPIDWGHDVEQIRANLALTPTERIQRGVERSRARRRPSAERQEQARS